MKQIHIVGAGITGLSIARYLKNDKVHIWEKEEIGGLCSSFKIGEFTFDRDAHFLHFRSPRIKEEVLEKNKDILIPHKRSSWIYWQGKLIPFPFQRHLSYLPSPLSSRILTELLSYCQGKDQNNAYLGKLLLSRYGPTLYNIFFLPYLSKFYKISPDKIPFKEVKDFFPLDNVHQVLTGLLDKIPQGEIPSGTFSKMRTFQPGDKEKSNSGYNSTFYYPPSGGIGTFMGRWKEGVEKNIKKGVVSKIYWEKKEIEVEGEGMSTGNTPYSRIPYDLLICTFPLPELFKALHPFPAKFSHLLPFFYANSILCYNIGIKGDNWKGVHWTYFPEKEFIFFRVGFYSHIAPLMAPPKCSSIYVEVALHSQGQDIEGNLEKRVIEDLIKAGILKNKREIEVIKPVYIPSAYPLFLGQRKELDNFKHWLQERGILLAGRYGAWKYYSMEDCIKEGRRIGESVDYRL
ncbi:MAG: NAD(P)-binding protein [Caldiserica bacterium]|nr:NAD(P)-binding protein [Caldisericota bacterium]